MFVELRGQDAGEDVTADETAKDGKEPDEGVTWQIPGERGGSEFLKLETDWIERAVGEGLYIEAGEEVLHHRIAHDHDVFEPGGEIVEGEEKFGNDLAKLLTDEPGEDVPLAGLYGEVNAAHHIRAMLRLSIQGRADCEHMAGAQVEQLSSDGGGAQIDGNAQARLRRKWKG